MNASPSSTAAIQRTGLGIVLRIVAMACVAGLFGLAKWCSQQGVPVLQIVFFRNAFAFLPLGIYIWRTSGLRVLRTRRLGGHLTRAAVGLSGMVFGFMAVSRLPLTQSTALAFSAPLFMTALSALILKERVGVHRWAAVAVGFVGVLIMVRPDPANMELVGTAIALAGAMGAAGAMIAIRQIADTEPGPTIVFYFTLCGTVFGLASLPFGWVVPDPLTLAMLAMCGLVGGVAQLFLTESLRRAPVAVVAPFDYSQLIWASLIGYLVWDDLPHGTTLVGAAVVAASGIYILFRETRRFRER